MSKQLRIWLFVLLGTLLTSTTLLAEGVITLTTSRAVGETIKLRIEANGNVTIEGAQDTGQKEYYSYELYRLSSQTITIRGDVTYLSCSEEQLTSLNVSGCTALTTLSCGDNQLTSLDVSKNVALTGLYCSNNQLTSLDVWGCTALRELYCSSNKLTSLDVSKNTALTRLYCSSNKLTSLDLSGCTALTELSCSSNPLTSINLSGCQSLKEFSWTGGKLTSLDVSGCTALTTLSCSSNQLTRLEASGCTALTKLYCSSNQLTSLDVSGCTALTKLYCDNNQLTSLDLSGCTALTKLGCSNNQLTSLNVLGYTALTKLDCSSNKLTSLDLSGCTALTELRCYSNQLASLDLSGCTALTWLYCSDNPLTSINLSNCTSLEEFTWNENKLTSLDVSGCTSLTKLDCGGNPLISVNLSNCALLQEFTCNEKNLTRLNVSGCSSLTKLDCYGNQLTSLDVSGCTALTKLDCNKNQLTRLDVSGCTALTKLYCDNNQLTSLDVSKNTALTKLDCNNNQLTNLVVSGCASLTELKCSYNQLTSLDVSGCTALTKLDCYKNRLKGEAMTQMVAGLSDRNEKLPGALNVVCDEADENNLLRSDALTASRKNWRVFKYLVNAGMSVLYSGTGDDEIVMTITQEQYLEGGIRLAILADGDVTIEGVHEKRIFTDGSKHTYTLAGTQITIRGNVSELDCSKNQLTNIDVSKSTSLWTLNCSSNRLTNVDVSGCSLLIYLNCSDNQINGENMTRLVTHLPSRTGLRSGNLVIISRRESEGNLCRPSDVAIAQEKNWISTWENGDLCKGIGEGVITMTTSLSDGDPFELSIVAKEDVVIEGVKEELNRIYGQSKVYSLTSQTVTIRGHVTSLGCSDNRLTSLDVSGCTSLTNLDCSNNWQTSLDVSGCTALTKLDCFGNELTSLDLSKNTALTELDCSSNKLTSLDVSGCTALTKLDCNENQLTSLNVSSCTALTELSCRYNQLTSLNASGCTALTELDCQDNRLTSLNVSSCTALTKLDCSNNKLSSLDLLQSRTLTELDCSRNKLETLDLSACSNLESLTCYRNKIRGNAVAQLVESLPDRYGKDPGKFYFVYYSEDEYEENFCYRPAVGRANDKNWRPQKRYNGGWEDYFGVIDEGVVMMRTAQEVGSKITLTLEAKGDVAIDGVKGVPETDGKPHQYTLISQDVTIRGYVTKLHCSGNKLTSLDLSTTVPLVELDCSNNQLTALDVSQNAALTSLACYRNQIKGEAMALLIKGLPQLPLRSTHLFGIVSNAADEGNVFLKADVKRVQDKGWSPMKWDEERQQYEPYAGKETETFAVTLTKEGEGTITATGADDLTAVPYGTELKIVATPTEGYELISLTAGEEDILATKKVVVTDNVTVKATFDEATFAVTLTSNEHGDITIVEPVDLRAVPYGTTLTVKATGKNAQCVLTALTANGKDILATQSFVVTGATEVKATFVDHTGVETTVTQQVKLYPNPATDYVIVEGVAAASEVTLHSMTGERLYAGRADDRGTLQIDLTPYADGVYLVCVAGETYRVVVRH